jgi:hypothetical protein
VIIRPAHPGVKALRVIVGGVDADMTPESIMRERLHTALSAVQAWLEDAEIQIHNSRSILQRLADPENGTGVACAGVAALHGQIGTIAIEVRNTLNAVERVMHSGSSG